MDKGEICKVCADPDCPVHDPKKQQRRIGRTDHDAATMPLPRGGMTQSK
jgi:hypothetical protein